MSSPPQTVHVLCPKCGRKYEDWYRPSINRMLDDFDDDYVREATTGKCPDCGTVVDLGSLIVGQDGVWTLKE
jgi:endogenous inhibitor of DNA gyrase (YacG/DUF329 family)